MASSPPLLLQLNPSSRVFDFVMKRDFDEISEEEWQQHSFNPSRVLKQPRAPKTTTTRTPPPRRQQPNPSPPIESFAYRRPSKAIESDDDCVVVEDSGSGESDSDVKIVNGGDDLLLDDEEEEEEEEEEAKVVVVRRARVGRRFVIEDEEGSEEDEVEVEEVSSSEGEDGGGGDGDEDVVGMALQKCAKISADLRKELYGSSSGVTTCDRYSEVESSTVRIVTQVPSIFNALRMVCLNLVLFTGFLKVSAE